LQCPNGHDMATKSVHCPVLGAHVTHVTDLDGTVRRIICAEYDSSNGGCRRKRSGSGAGPLVQLLERAAEGIAGSRSVACIFRSR